MPADIDAEHRFFVGQKLGGVPLGDVGVLHFGRLFLDDVAEEGHLRARPLLVDGGETAHELLVHCMILRALLPHRIERAAVDETLHHLFVDEPDAAHDEVGEVLERTVRLALLDDLLHRRDAHAAQRTQPEAQPVPLHGEVGARLVDVGRVDGDVLLLHVDDVFGDLVDLVDAVIEDARKELLGIVLFEERRLIGDDGIRRRVRLVEGVGGEALHLREELGAHLGRDAARGAARDVPPFVEVAVDELVLLRHQLGAVFLCHGAAHEVCLSQRVPRKVLEDLHDLLLIDDDAVRLFKDGL